MRMLFGCAMVLTLAITAGTQAAKQDTPIDAKKIVGKWEPKEEKKTAKMVLEFTKDGKLTLTGESGGKELKMEGKYKVQGNKLELNLKFGDQEFNETVTLTKLTDTEMEGVGKDGKQDAFKRIK